MGSCCSTSKGMGKRIDTVELSTVDSADDASPKTKNSSKRWKKKKTGGDQVGCKDLGHEIDIPGRLIANGGSKVACLYTQQGKKGTNQDAMLVWEVCLHLLILKVSNFDCLSKPHFSNPYYCFCTCELSYYICRDKMHVFAAYLEKPIWQMYLVLDRMICVVEGFNGNGD